MSVDMRIIPPPCSIEHLIPKNQIFQNQLEEDGTLNDLDEWTSARLKEKTISDFQRSNVKLDTQQSMKYSSQSTMTSKSISYTHLHNNPGRKIYTASSIFTETGSIGEGAINSKNQRAQTPFTASRSNIQNQMSTLRMHPKASLSVQLPRQFPLEKEIVGPHSKVFKRKLKLFKDEMNTQASTSIFEGQIIQGYHHAPIINHTYTPLGEHTNTPVVQKRLRSAVVTQNGQLEINRVKKSLFGKRPARAKQQQQTETDQKAVGGIQSIKHSQSSTMCTEYHQEDLEQEIGIISEIFVELNKMEREKQELNFQIEKFKKDIARVGWDIMQKQLKHTKFFQQKVISDNEINKMDEERITRNHEIEQLRFECIQLVKENKLLHSTNQERVRQIKNENIEIQDLKSKIDSFKRQLVEEQRTKDAFRMKLLSRVKTMSGVESKFLYNNYTTVTFLDTLDKNRYKGEFKQ